VTEWSVGFGCGFAACALLLWWLAQLVRLRHPPPDGAESSLEANERTFERCPGANPGHPERIPGLPDR